MNRCLSVFLFILFPIIVNATDLPEEISIQNEEEKLISNSLPSTLLHRAIPKIGIAMHGDTKYHDNFKNFDYVIPNIKKGGLIRFASFGTFDTFNPFVINGTPADGAGLMYDTLMVESYDEPFSEYGLIAKTIEMPVGREWVAFNLNKHAKFSDGTPITSEDVAFSFEILKKKGLPAYRYYYSGVDKVLVENDYRIVFIFKKESNLELPLIIGQLPIFPKHYWKDKDFFNASLDIPVVSGAYQVNKFEPGRYVIYKRNEDYWAKDIPVKKGTDNFDFIRYDYYRDSSVAIEALKAGLYDFRLENEAKKWQKSYKKTSPYLVKKMFRHALPSGMQGFAFNIRRQKFQDKNVRKAIGKVFDFEWTNKNLFSSMYVRTKSYFDNSELSSTDLLSEDEIRLLKEYPTLPNEIFADNKIEKTDGSGFIRNRIVEALDLLKQSGWILQDGILRNEKGEKFSFEILLDASLGSAWERITLPFVQNLRKIGIQANIRSVDAIQYKNRLSDFDFDMIVNVWGQSLSPGNEQQYFWGSLSADEKGTYNYIGIKDDIIDDLIKKIIEAKNRHDLVVATKVLDRILLYNYYVIPHWHLPGNNVVYWDKFIIPDKESMKGVNFLTWGYDETKAKKLENLEIKPKESLFQKLKSIF